MKLKLRFPGTITLQTKLNMLVLLFLILPLALFGYFWYEKSKAVIEDNAITLSREIDRNVNLQLDYYFKDIDKLTLPLLNNEVY